MDEAAKKRLIGAVVLVLLMVIFVPMLFEEPSPPESDGGRTVEVPAEPDFQSRPAEEVFLAPTAPVLNEQSLGADELGPIDGLAPDEAAPFAPEGSAASDDPPRQMPIEPVAEPVVERAPRDEPAPAAARSAPPATPAARAEAPASVARPDPVPTVRAGAFVVQIAALSTAERASALADELRRQGFSSFTERAEVGGKTYFRVRVGPEADRAAAERLAEAVKRNTGHQGQVLVHR
ncbi:SPOR domain-containing protein [Thiococcus pfennigii]|uniref:SPOR domain-containing protein n=1 Tax=Thiococcus pfennigii TaxID=1057 RepID=UPI0019053AAB|nr:SPOR domain-containing protein [Thiococcus pfennigii]MBK1732430.1 hypothetical protein [Thiococcus pfennigii]